MQTSWSAPVNVRSEDRIIITGVEPKATLVFSSDRDAKRILNSADTLILGEAFVHGVMDIEGDICSAVAVKDEFAPDELTVLNKAKIVFNVLRSYRRHSLVNDSHYIQHHYDHPDDFYKLFLGRTMTYSCAYFRDDRDSLEKAQEQKHNHLLDKLMIHKDEKLLDIGCGWGSLVIKAAVEYGANSVGITLSPTQFEYANNEIARLGMGGRCRVELIDYRQLDPGDQYDKIVSVGMYEHVGRKNLDGYFKTVHDLLRPDGLFVNHGITRTHKPDWRKASEARFIDKYIFPGGELHPSGRVVSSMEAAGFEVYDVESLRKHYAKTLREWVARLRENDNEARRIVPEEIYRAWLIYMAGCALAFEEGYLNVHQVCGSKSAKYGGQLISMTRDYLYAT